MNISLHPITLVRRLLACGLALLCFHVCTSGTRAQTVISTVPEWVAGGYASISQLGTAASNPNNTPTVGETFVPPAGATTLNSFTFYLQSQVPGSQITIQGEVFDWFGSMLAGGSNPGPGSDESYKAQPQGTLPVGTPSGSLYTSLPFTYTASGGWDAVTVAVPGVTLTPGNPYVIDFTAVVGDGTTVGNAVFGNTWEYLFGGLGATDQGGGNFSNPPGNEFGAWNEPGFGFYGDLAFTASFSGGAGALGATSRLEGPLAGTETGSDSVVLPASFATATWTASVDAGDSWWLFPPTGNSGPNVIFTYAANVPSDANGSSTRTGTITVTSGLQTLTFTVTQAGSAYEQAPGPVTPLASGLQTPSGVAVDVAGNVFFADSGNNQIYTWAPPNGPVAPLVSSSTSTGLSAPSGVAVDAADNVYIADSGNHAIKMWSPGSASTPFATAVSLPSQSTSLSVAVDAAGNVYVADAIAGAIYEWTPGNLDTTYKTLFSQSFGFSPVGIAVDAAGNIYIANSDSAEIEELSPENSFSALSLPLFSSLSGSPPGALAVDGAGNVYIVDTANNAIEEWPAAAGGGAATLVSSASALSSGLSTPAPMGVAVDGAGNVYFSDSASANLAIEELPYAWVDPTPNTATESPSSGSDSLPPVLPTTANLSGPFAPTSDPTSFSWLRITGTNNGVVSFGFTANPTTSIRTGQLHVLGAFVTVEQGAGTGPTPPSGCATPPSGIVNWWPGEGSMTDIVGGDTGIAEGMDAIEFPPGEVSDAFSFDGNDFLTTSSPVNNPQNFTLECWFKTTTTQGGVLIGFAQDQYDTGGASDRFIYMDNSGYLRFGVLYNNFPYTLETPLWCNDGVWHHVAATHSAIDGINLYLDGVPVGGNTGVFGAQEYSGYWRIGEDNIVNWPDGPSQPNFKGLIDEVSIYNRELSAAEIQSIYMAGNLGKCKAALASGTIVLGANSRLEGPGPGSDSVVLGATYPITSWTAAVTAVPPATSPPTWLHLSPIYESGAGSTNLVFTYDQNMGAATQAGNITITGPSGQTVLTVTQAGSAYVQAPGPVTPLFSASLDLPLGLTTPAGVAVDGAGNVYMADSGNGQIDEWTAASGQATVLLTGFSNPQGVAVDNQGGYLYIADAGNGSGNGAIDQWTLGSTSTTYTPVVSQSSPLVPPGFAPTAVAVDSQGNVYIADSGTGQIEEWMPGTGSFISLVSSGSGFNHPEGVAVDAAGNVYIADTGNSQVEEWSPGTGGLTTLLSSFASGFGSLTTPSGVAVNAAGNVYVADSYWNAIFVWTAATGQTSQLIPSVPFPAPTMFSPFGVAVDGAGDVYMADTGNLAVEELPYAFVNPTPTGVPMSGGSGFTLPPVLPPSVNLNMSGPFAPTFTAGGSTLSPTITSTAGGVVSFNLSQPNNTGFAQTGNFTVLGEYVPVTQAAVSGSPTAFSGLNATPSINQGATHLILGGTVTGAGAQQMGEPISVTIDGNTQTTSINDNSGDFSFSYNPSTISTSATITYSYPGDLTLNGTSDSSTTLTVNQVQIIATQLILVFPGETFTPPPGVGKTGTPFQQVKDIPVFPVSVYAVDANYNVDTTARTVNITSATDGTFQPAPVNLTGGSAPFPVTFGTAGTAETVTATDSVNPQITGTSSDITVTLPVVHFAISISSSGTPTAGTAFPITIMAQGISGQTVTSFNGTVNLTTMAGTITPAISGQFSAGVLSQSVIVSLAGTETITATSSGGQNGSASFTVNAGAATQLVFSSPVTTMAGVASGSITVQQQDQYGNPNMTDPDRIVTLSSTSSGTVTFNPTSLTIANGSSSQSFTYSDTLAGNPVITAASTSPTTITSATQQETVNAGPAVHIAWVLPGFSVVPGHGNEITGFPLPEQSGLPFSATVESIDANGNPVGIPDPTVMIQCDDSSATFPSSVTLGTDGISQPFTVILNAIRTTDLTASGTIGNMGVNYIASVPVIADASKLLIVLPGESFTPGSPKTGTPTPVAAGSTVNGTVYVVNPNNQVIPAGPGSMDTVTIECNVSNPSGNTEFVSTVNLTAGMGPFQVIFNTVGKGLVTATSSPDNLAGSSAPFLVNASDVALLVSTFYLPGSGGYVGGITEVTSGGVVSPLVTSLLFAEPSGLAFDSAGNLYAADSVMNTISQITPPNLNVSPSLKVVPFVTATEGLNMPAGLAFNSPYLYVANDYFTRQGNQSYVSMVAAEGGSTSKFPPSYSGFYLPAGMAFDSAGNLYAVNNGNFTISKVTPGGVASTYVNNSLLNTCYGLAIDSSGNVYTVGANGIIKIAPTTPPTVSTFVSESSLMNDGCVGLAFDSAGNLYVADQLRGKIFEIPPDGSGVFTLASLGMAGIGNIIPTYMIAAQTPTITCPGNLNCVAGQSLDFAPQVMVTGYPAPTAPNTVTYQFNGGIIPSPYEFPASGTVICTAANVAGSATCSFNVNVITPTQLVFTALPTSGAVAGTPFSVTVQAEDDNGDPAGPATSTTVILTASGGGTLSGTTMETIGTDGQTIFTPVYYSKSDTMQLTATATGLRPAISGNISFSPGAASAANSTISPPTIVMTADGTSTQTIAVQALDANNNLTTGGATVVLTLTGGGTLSGGTDNGNGTYTATYIGGGTYTATLTAPTVAGSATVTVALNTASVGTVSVNYAPGAPAYLQVLLPGETAVPGTTSGKTGTPTARTAGIQFNVTVNAVDANYNLVNTLTGLTGIIPSDTLASVSGPTHLSGGQATFQVTFRSLGLQSVSATDTPDGGLTGPSAQVQVNRPPFLYVSTSSGISEVSIQGVVSSFISATPGQQFKGLALDTAGNLYVADSGNDVIVKITPGGAVSPYVTLSQTLSEASGGLAFDNAGNLYIGTGASGLLEVAPGGGNGSVSYFPTMAELANSQFGALGSGGLAFDSAGNLYVAGSGTVAQVTPAGVATTYASSGLLQNSQGVAFDSSGNLYVANYVGGNNGTISEVTSGGTTAAPTVTTYASSSFLQGAQGLAFGGGGNLYVVNPMAGTIVQITPGGTVLQSPFASGLDYPQFLLVVPPAYLQVTAEPGMTMAGQVVSVTVNAVDPSGNPYTTASPTLEITSTDPNAVFTPSDSAPLSVGQATFDVMFKTAGNQSVTVSDSTSFDPLSSGTAPVTVVASAPSQLQVLWPGETPAPGTQSGETGAPTAHVADGTPVSVIVNAVDQYFNPVNTLGGLTGITSSDPYAILSAPKPLDGGTATFDVTFNTATSGPQTVTALDTPDGGLTGMSVPVQVNTSATVLFVSTAAGISKVTSDGTVSSFVSGTLFGRPSGLAFGGSGNLYANGNNSILEVMPGGNLSPYVNGLSSFGGLAFDSAGNLYVADNSTVLSEVAPGGGNGSVSYFPTMAEQANSQFVALGNGGLAFDSAGNLYVANPGNNTIAQVTPAGVATTFVPNGLNHPEGLAFDSAGNLYVANGNGTISKVTMPAGTTVTTYASSSLMQGSQGLAFDSAGNLYVVNPMAGPTAGTISAIPPGGTPVTTFASGLNNPQFVVAAQTPTITAPANIITGPCAASSVQFAATATGYPNPAITYSVNGSPINSGTSFSLGQTTVTCTAVNIAGTQSCTFTVDIDPMNSPGSPTAGPNVLAVTAGQTVSVPVAALLQSASSPSGGALSISSFTPTMTGAGGTVAVSGAMGSQVLTYTAPASSTPTTDTINYFLSDGCGMAPETITVNVGTSASPPTVMQTVSKGQTATVSAPSTSTQGGVAATLNNNGGSQTVTVSAQTYTDDPVSANFGFGPGTTYLDLKASGATTSDSMTAYFSYPATGTAATTAPTLMYFNSVGADWETVYSDMPPPQLPPVSLQNGAWQYTVIIDDFSTPTITQLTGTVFALATPAPILSISQSGNNAIISWPAPSTGYILQTSGTLANPTWLPYTGMTNVTGDGTSNYVTITPATGSLFFILAAP